MKEFKRSPERNSAPFEMVDAMLAETGATQYRVRELPSRVVVYLLLAGCLFADTARTIHRGVGQDPREDSLSANISNVSARRPSIARQRDVPRRLPGDAGFGLQARAS
jgi:hypothetical protein